MLKTSLIFIGLALAAVCFADLAITTLHPWMELARMLRAMAAPDFLSLAGIWRAFVNTVAFALCGTFLGVAAGTVLAFFFEYTPVRLFCAFIRAIHEIFWAFIFMPKGLEGIWNTVILTQIALAFTGVLAVVSFPLACVHFMGIDTVSQVIRRRLKISTKLATSY